ncbi:PGF-pre-PGF domain-containing protein [Methanolobus sp. ZRKC5]|uniref:PGF-pre-PGF domain-containing protein n=1 Tax=Methanolobus sp. ZRKC5 TaxID=3136295 RepID=UPI00313CF1CF
MVLASAASDEIVSISSDKINPGDNAHVIISIGNCANITGINLTLVYDQSIISLNSISENNSVVSGHVVDHVENITGIIDIQMMQLDNITTVEGISLIDIIFTTSLSGNSSLELQDVELFTGDTSYAPATTIDGMININSAPVFNAIGDLNVSVGELVSFNLSANDVDENDDLTFYNVSVLPLGSAFYPNNQSFMWEPASIGNYSVTFGVTDNYQTDTVTGTIVVNDTVVVVNHAPELATVSDRSVNESEELSFTLTANDVDNDTLVYSMSGLQEAASLNSTTGVFSWTPIIGDAGTYLVIFDVSDGEYNANESVSITVTSTSTSTSSTTSSSSSGGGGGSLSSGEKFENIDFKDYVLRSIVKDTETVFSFYKENNSIVSVSFTSKLNGGQVKAVVEMLKDTSSQVGSSAPGNVYENMNLHIDSKLASDAISNPKINFKVEKSWINENEIDLSTITLCRYSDSNWGQLPTERQGEDDLYFYFASTTPGFSPFAISSVESAVVINGNIVEDVVASSQDAGDTVMSTEDAVSRKLTTETNQESRSSLSFVFVLALVGFMVIGAVGYRNRGYYNKVRLQVGNPDGKRYRRIKQ